MAVKIDAVTEGRLVHPYLSKAFTTKFEERWSYKTVKGRKEKYQKVLWQRTHYKIQWKNILYDIRLLLREFLRGLYTPGYALRGAVSFDAATRGSVTPAATSLTFSHTTSSSSGRALFAGMCITSATTMTATYNSVALTINTATDNREQTGYLGNPDSGANNIVFSLGASRVIVGLVMTFTGGNGTISDFTEDSGNAKTSTSITVPNFASGDMIAEMLLISADDPTNSSAGADQTIRLAFSQQPPGDANATVTAASTNATNGTCTWSWTTARHATSGGMRVQNAAAASTGVVHNFTLMGIGT